MLMLKRQTVGQYANYCLTGTLVIFLGVLGLVAIQTKNDLAAARTSVSERDSDQGNGGAPTPVTDALGCRIADGDGRAIVDTLDGGAAGNQVWFWRSEQLCTLYQVDASQTRIVPVARSYYGNEWEPYLSDYQDIEIECTPSACLIDLPVLEEGYTLQLAAFNHTLPQRDEVARFLEQTTFGPTRAALDSFPSTFAKWAKEQQTVVPMTSHREYYRKRLNDRAEYQTQLAGTTHPCETGTRYRKYAFSAKDAAPYVVEVQTDSLGRRVFLRDELIYTVYDEGDEPLFYNSRNNDRALSDGPYFICSGLDYPGGEIRVSAPDGCKRIEFGDQPWLNPPVFFDDITPPNNPVVTLDGHVQGLELDQDGNPQSLLVTSDVEDPHCAAVPTQKGSNRYLVVALYKGEYWLHDPRWRLAENTIENPLSDGGGALELETFMVEEGSWDWNLQVQCSNAPMNSFNMAGCKLSRDPKACSQRDPSTVSVALSTESLQTIYEATGGGEEGTRYVYAVQNLRQTSGDVPYGSPCSPGTPSRWIPTSDCGQQILDSASAEIFANLLRKSNDINPYIRDISFPLTGIQCQPGDVNKFNMRVQVDSRCYLNVHRDHLSVFDFTPWVQQHPGGVAPIQQFAQEGADKRFTLSFPASHPMSRWYEESEPYRIEIGRLGDSLVFNSFPTELLTEDVAVAFQASKVLQTLGPTVVCGSPNEVANDPTIADQVFGAETSAFVTAKDLKEQKGKIWNMIALYEEDGLRQRVAWALSQILVIAVVGVGDTTETESYLSFYDIFVRNAFGNYRDILKEVSFHSMMGDNLSYLDNQSTESIWKTRKRVEYADENYAREIMQLFSIGLTKLNNDGTPVKDTNGVALRTYTNDEITEYARVWTGFRRHGARGNMETRVYRNRVDPMRIEVGWRDAFPKLGLDQTYVGDGLPLCSDLPAQHFLRKGATYVLLGSQGEPRFHAELDGWSVENYVKRFQLKEESSLYKRLCNADSGECQYEVKIVLDEDYECIDLECEIETPRIVEVEKGMFYEYLRLPCAFQAFYAGGQMLQSKTNHYICADSRAESGLIGCCAPGNGRSFSIDHAHFSGERISYDGAEQRCAKDGLEICQTPRYTCPNGCDIQLLYWSSVPCELQVKINLDGTVAMVHSMPEEIDADPDKIEDRVRLDTKTFFRVVWSEPIGDIISDYDDMCSSLGCERDPYDNLCLCTVEVEDKVAFESSPTKEQVLGDLAYGAFSPYDFWDDRIVTDIGNEIKLHSDDGTFTTTSVFEVMDDNGIRQFRKNVLSEVSLGSTSGLRLSFRNPTNIIDVTHPEQRDALYETDATIDHYIYHPNTAPFLAIRFAQRFGVANPSPRYIDTIATAFRTGRYFDIDTSIVFGSGTYGDLAATTAAVILDREVRSVILDADPSHGSLLEPLLRFIRLMKSLEFEPADDRPTVDFTNNIYDLIGQEQHNFPDVFSFFKPEYQPPGTIGDAGLVCPECQLLTATKVVNLLNGVFALVKYGFDDALGGLGNGRSPLDPLFLGDTSRGEGELTYTPDVNLNTAKVIDELATLLTSGRLSAEKRALLQTAYGQLNDDREALIRMQELIATTPEFHTNGLARATEDLRPTRGAPVPSTRPYKAVIQLLLSGGWDSFNVLAPEVCHGKNAAGETLDEQYRAIRGGLALSRSEVGQRITAQNQPCSEFAIHDELSFAKELYDEGSLAFLANVGIVADATMTKTDYLSKTVTGLFGHNTMQKENQLIDPFRQERSTGMLGRLSEVLTSKGYKTSGISIDDPSFATSTLTNGDAPDPLIISRFGATRFAPLPRNEEKFDLLGYATQLNPQNDLYSNLFGETWSEEFTSGVGVGNMIDDLLQNTQLGSHWDGSSSSTRSHKMVASLIQTRGQRGVDRDTYFYQTGFWDHHADMKTNLRDELKKLNEGMRLLVQELKDQGIWDDVAIVVTSDFGRTLTQNGRNGSDHAWGGNYMIMGGKVKGGQVLGKYPEVLTEDGPWSIGRARMMPSTSWDAVWNGVSEWMGVEADEEMLGILPNLPKAHGGDFTPPMSASDLFRI